MRRIRVWFAKSGLDRKDAVIGVGLLMVGVGFWLVHPPLALIVVGIGLFGLGTGLIRIVSK